MSLSPSILSFGISLVYGAWCRTLRYEPINEEPVRELVARGERLVLCMWHNELFPMTRMKKFLGTKLVAIVSQSRDGEILARFLERQGLATARGSSSKGGANALKVASRMMREQGMDAVVTVDGPRGPRHVVKKGAIYLAHKTGAYLVPTRLTMSRAKEFKSWDRFLLPWPFSKVRVIGGEPYRIEAETLSSEVVEQERARLQETLNGLV